MGFEKPGKPFFRRYPVVLQIFQAHPDIVAHPLVSIQKPGDAVGDIFKTSWTNNKRNPAL
ncbi:MAG: hypothetical protein PHH09_07260 [Methanoregulaceae archaeon]|nr:hypothetical protein [Methanoregulaceae archaeon]